MYIKMIHSKVDKLRSKLDKIISQKVKYDIIYQVDLDNDDKDHYIDDIANNLQNIFKPKYTLVNY